MPVIELGHEMEHLTAESEPTKGRMTYPTLTLAGAQIPAELKAKGIGDGVMCRLEIVAKKIGDTIDTYHKDRPHRVELELQTLKYLGHAGKKTKDEYMKMNDEEREQYDREDVGADEKDEASA